jgi:hypothetical protein
LNPHDETCGRLVVVCDGSATITARAKVSLCLAQHILRKIAVQQVAKDGTKNWALDIWGVRDAVALVDDHGLLRESSREQIAGFSTNWFGVESDLGFFVCSCGERRRGDGQAGESSDKEKFLAVDKSV